MSRWTCEPSLDGRLDVMKADGESQTRRLLLIGFGGLLLLLAFAGLNGISAVRTIQSRNEEIRREYVMRDRILEQLRSDIYLSGTYVRDLLLDPDPKLAQNHLADFDHAQRRIEVNTAAYANILLPEEREAFQRFTAQLHRYFESLSPALHWNPAERREFGYAFVRESLLPQRTDIVQLTDQLSSLNQKQLEAGDRQVKTLFESFERLLVVFLILSLCSGSVVAGISFQRLLRSEKLSSMRLREVLRARGDLRDLSARLLQIQESERRAIARELHDEVGQSVSGLLLGIGNVAATLSPEGNASALSQLRELRFLAERTLSELRDLSLLLRPSMLDDLGLLPALHWQAREVARTRNLSVQVSADDRLEDSLSDDQKTCIYRVVQEALHNVARHAAARNVNVQLSEEPPHELLLVVQDDGRGFTPDREKGVGLLGMEERVRHLGGAFRVESKPGGGTAVVVRLPLHAFAMRAS